MNILFFLTPKSDVAYIEDSFSLRQILEKMEIHRYSAIPILSNTGRHHNGGRHSLVLQAQFDERAQNRREHLP